MTLTEHLQSIGACAPAVRWSRGKTAREAWATCAEPGWGIWWVARVKGFAAVEPVVRRAVLRAARGYTACARERAGLHEHAAKLRAIPDDASFAAIRDMCRVAYAYDAAVYANAAASYAAAYASYAAAYADNAAAYAANAAAAYAAAYADNAYADNAAANAAADAERGYQLSDLRELCAPPWTEDDK